MGGGGNVKIKRTETFFPFSPNPWNKRNLWKVPVGLLAEAWPLILLAACGGVLVLQAWGGDIVLTSWGGETWSWFSFSMISFTFPGVLLSLDALDSSLSTKFSNSNTTSNTIKTYSKVKSISKQLSFNRTIMLLLRIDRFT